MQKIPEIAIADYQYPLPDERIAKYPLPERDASRLLQWRQGNIAHGYFRELPGLLTGNEILFFNNTRVIPARLYFQKDSGALIEIFLLSPEQPAVVDQAMRAGTGLRWKCTIGNLKRWKDGVVLEQTVDVSGTQVVLRAILADRMQQIVRFEWAAPEVPFVQLIEAAGQAPIPPYLHREAVESDKITYQTVYGKKEGAVAAPTAGLHFTPAMLQAIAHKGVREEELTLHVSAGTFRPVKSANAIEHDMHSEQVVLRRSNVEALLTGRPVVAVGTTSLRTLESVYWYGVKLLDNPDAAFTIGKLDPYDHEPDHLPDLPGAAAAVLQRMDREGANELWGETQIFIFPGYRFRVVDVLITNFHQPGSTLLLLIAAFTGGEAWKEIYDEALREGYRFLSYGDGSVLWKGGGELREES